MAENELVDVLKNVTHSYDDFVDCVISAVKDYPEIEEELVGFIVSDERPSSGQIIEYMLDLIPEEDE